MRNSLFLGAAVVALAIPAAAAAQETTATIRGTVTAGGTAVPGAQITIINIPTNTRTTTQSGADGTFTQTGLQAGGPYTVEVTSPQGNKTVTDVFTVVQQAYTLPIDLTPATADAGAGAGRDGYPRHECTPPERAGDAPARSAALSPRGL